MMVMMCGFFLMDSGVVATGLSYQSDKDDNSRVQNIDVAGVYLGYAIPDVVKNWNMSTQLWLKYYVYIRQLNNDRAKNKGFNMSAVAIVFTVVAVWHGFYEGYMHFFGCAIYYIWQAK